MKRPRRRSPSRPARPLDPAARILDAAIDLAGRRDWNMVSLADVAKAAGVDLLTVHRCFPGKAALVAGFIRRIDESVLAGNLDSDDSPRDRLFEVLMRRFDALNRYRSAALSFRRGVCRDPLAAAILGPIFLCSMALMLEVAAISTSGPMGILRLKGLAALWIVAFQIWTTDDSADLAKTMAALDRGLRRGEALLGGLDRLVAALAGGGARER